MCTIWFKSISHALNANSPPCPSPHFSSHTHLRNTNQEVLTFLFRIILKLPRKVKRTTLFSHQDVLPPKGFFILVTVISLHFSLPHFPPRNHLHHGECPVINIAVQLRNQFVLLRIRWSCCCFLCFFVEVLQFVRTTEKSDDGKYTQDWEYS